MTSGWCYRCAEDGKINYEDLVWIESSRDGRLYPICKNHLKKDDIVAEFRNITEDKK